MAGTTTPRLCAHRRRLLPGAALAAVVGAFALWSGPVMAGWLSGGVGSGHSIAQSVPQGAAPVAVATGREVTVTWDQTLLSGGTPADGYVVRRYADGGAAVTVLDGCDGTIAATTCTESAVPTGTWRYTVEPLHTGWNGTESAPGGAITVGNATLTFSSPTTIPAASLPATLSGTVTHFLAGETLTFHLDGPAGPVLTGSPAVVDDTGSASITVMIPTGTDDAPHSVFAVGDVESAASAAITVLDPPVLQTLAMFDVDANGKVDRLVATFQEPLAPYSAGVGPWTLAAAPSGASLSAVTVSGNAATLQLAEGGGAADTAVGAFTVALAENSSGIRDVNGQRGSFAATAPADKASPALTSTPAMLDLNANGRVDQVTMSFSEPMAAYSAATIPWTLANVPSGGALSTVTVPTSTTVALTMAEGAGAEDTAVGGFRLGLAADVAGIRDAVGNLTSFTGVVPADQAKPIRLIASAFDDTANGKFDRLAVTFSEPLATYGAGNTGWTFASAPTGSSLRTVTVAAATADLNLNEGTTATTAVGSWTVALATNAAGIRDAAGNLSGFTATPLADKAAPRPTGPPQVFDAVSVNGRVDRVTVVMSETLATYTAGVAPWTLTNVPSGGSLASVTVATTTATLTLAEGAGPLDTAVGAMTVALAGDPVGGIRDAAGNATTLAAVAPLDKAAPFRVGQVIYDDNGNGRFDRILTTFSEPLATYTAPSTVWTFSAPPTGLTLNNVSVAGSAATLNLNEGSTVTTAVASTFKVGLTANAAGIRDAAANLAGYSAVVPVDGAAPVVVGAPQLLDTNVNGKVDKVTVAMSETLGTYTAGVTPWTLTNVPSGGTVSSVTVAAAIVTVNLTEGAGAADTSVGAMAVAMATNVVGVRDVVFNAAASFGPVAPLDKAVPARLSASAFDDDANAKFDRVAVSFSEPLAAYSAGVTPWTFATPPAGMTVNNVTVSGATATLALNEGSTQTTAIGSWTIALAADAAGIRDGGDNRSSYAAAAPSDKAAPVALGVPQLFDATLNGKVDKVTVAMSETLGAYTAGVTPWTLTNVPSGGTVSSVTVSTTIATLNIAEGAGPADTSVGTMTVAMATNAAGLRDAAGNATASFGPVAPLDKAVPARLSASAFDDDANAKFDRVAVSFSEPLAAYSAGVTPWTFATPPAGMTVNNVTVSGATATLALNEGSTQTTAIGSWTIALASNAAGIRDAAGNLSVSAAAAPTDKAGPVATGPPQLLDSNANGKVDKVTLVMSETLLTYSAGTTPWTLANVPSGGTLLSATATTTSTATVTLTLTEGAGAADTTVGAMTVAMNASATGLRDAAGNLTPSFGPVTPIDKAAPVRLSMSAFDDNANGRFDRVAAVYSEPLAPYTAGTTPWTFAAAPTGATLNNVTVSGATATLTLTEGSTQTTAVGSWTVALAANAAGIRDAAGNTFAHSAVAPTDKAAPVPVGMLTRDTLLGDGIVDTVSVLMSEALTTYTAGITPWTLANVPSARTLSAAAVSSSTVTLTLAGGTGVPDTTVGTFTVALTPSSTGVRDVGLNQSSFAATAALDGAGPAPVSVTGTSGATVGRIEPGDTVTVLLSEPLGPAVTVPATTTVTMADPLGAGNDTLAIPGLLSGARSTASDSYIGGDATSAAFASSPVLLSDDRRTITVTVGPTCAGTGCASVTTAPSAAAFSFLADPALLDAAGNVPAIVAKSFTIRLF